MPVPGLPAPAEGFGALTPGGRGGREIAVTSLADSGPGTFRDAVSAKGPRIVRFEAAGLVTLASPVVIREPFLTIDGSTAPGDGVCIRGDEVSIRTHDVIVRHLRFRPGDLAGKEVDALNVMEDSHHVLIDHVSASWAVDEVLSPSGSIHDVTVQWSIVAEGLNHSVHSKGPHGYGSLVRAAGGVSLHHNLWIHNDSRNPRLGDDYGRPPWPVFDVRNNVIYDFGSIASGMTGDRLSANYVANYIRPGPASNAQRGPIVLTDTADARFYLQGNVVDGRDDLTNDNARLFDRTEVQGRRLVTLVDRPFAAPPVTTSTAAEALRDGVDARLVRDVERRTGRIIDSQKDVGGWPAYETVATYTNPILHADYSDPDVVRVGGDYYMTASSFSHVPGLPILHSKDLVNWTLVGHALPRLVPEDVFRAPQHGKGVWAPAIRHHDGRFWIYYPDPDFGIYVTTAQDPRGPWTAPSLVKAGKGLIDPCPLWDDDGRAYLVHAWARSRAGFANVITLNRMSADGMRVTDEGHVIVNGDALAGYTTLEGPKIYKRNGEYWIFAPAGGVKSGWQSVFRARSIDGPYEARIVLRQGSTDINGPHQGAWVDTSSGQDWFIHFQDRDAYGRIVHLEPMTWRPDGWPVMGDDADGDGTGEPVRRAPMPDVGATYPAASPATSDEFDGTSLGLQWQWQANPGPQWISLTANPGALRQYALQPRAAFRETPNLLLQKWSGEAFQVTAALSPDGLEDGSTAGLIVFGRDYAWIGVRRQGKGFVVVSGSRREADTGDDIERAALRLSSGQALRLRSGQAGELPARTVQLRVSVESGGRCRFSYSADGRAFTAAGEVFTARPGVWVGAKTGLFAVGGTAPGAGGHADWDWFRVDQYQ